MRIACYTDQKVLKEMLEQLGHKCIVYDRERELLDGLRNHPFDVVLTDPGVVARHADPESRDWIESHGYSFDRSRSRAWDRGTPVALTQREFDLAWMLFSSPGVLMSKKIIGAAMWGIGEEACAHRIEQCVHATRKKLGMNRRRGVTIRVVYSKGYILDLENVEEIARKAA